MAMPPPPATFGNGIPLAELRKQTIATSLTDFHTRYGRAFLLVQVADVVADAASEHGIVPLMGPPGTVIVFDCLIIHGSAPNVSPWPRRIFYMNFVPAASCDLKPLRPRLDCDPVPIALTPLAENCLVAP